MKLPANFIGFESKVEHRHEVFLLSIQPQIQGATATGIFFPPTKACALYSKYLPIDYLAVEEELRKFGDFGKIEHRYLLSLIDATFTTARDEASRQEKSFSVGIACLLKP